MLCREACNDESNDDFAFPRAVRVRGARVEKGGVRVICHICCEACDGPMWFLRHFCEEHEDEIFNTVRPPPPRLFSLYVSVGALTRQMCPICCEREGNDGVVGNLIDHFKAAHLTAHPPQPKGAKASPAKNRIVNEGGGKAAQTTSSPSKCVLDFCFLFFFWPFRWMI
jgi:hypothetical protein